MNEPQKEKFITREVGKHARAFILIAGVVFAVEAINFIAPDVIQKEKPATISVWGGGARDKGNTLERVELSAEWGNLGMRMVETGVIDRAKFEALYQGRGGLTEDEKRFLETNMKGNIVVTQENAGFILNLLWGLGLGNENTILEKGQMADARYGGAGGFASTGGWTLANGDAMEHYSAHPFITLTQKQQRMVESVSGNIYRPCCNNPAIFPDCNHGMAMLGLLELMASQGVSEAQMYKTALAVNAYWFPDTYTAIAKYFAKRGTVWANIDPKEALSATYSSAQGYRQILSEVEPSTPKGGGGCGV